MEGWWISYGVLRNLVFFFFQAEDGIRDVAVTGVQTCALPICSLVGPCRTELHQCRHLHRCRKPRPAPQPEKRFFEATAVLLPESKQRLVYRHTDRKSVV